VPIIPGLRRLRLEGHEVKNSLNYIVRPYQERKKGGEERRKEGRKGGKEGREGLLFEYTFKSLSFISPSLF
jgi:hypothetical protein